MSGSLGLLKFKELQGGVRGRPRKQVSQRHRQQAGDELFMACNVSFVCFPMVQWTGSLGSTVGSWAGRLGLWLHTVLRGRGKDVKRLPSLMLKADSAGLCPLA